ncbi:hypothetical protein PV11_02328 [Exophiala sideris]|uniref:Uncharacterized protein n=1 Tax=Exophiala sideris TaxID=1016849 RepID=A0A0D1ZIU2_9EURO|nr:hypothetical protein PV11_02328 [Exophiala sideris]
MIAQLYITVSSFTVLPTTILFGSIFLYLPSLFFDLHSAFFLLDRSQHPTKTTTRQTRVAKNTTFTITRKPGNQHSLSNMATNTSDGNAASAGQLLDSPPQHVYTTTITEAEKRALIVLYAELFCKHMKTKFPDVLQRTVALSFHIEQQAQLGAYKSVNDLHDDYDMLYGVYLSHFPDMVPKVGSELSKFAIARPAWWKRCLAVPVQAKRLDLVKAVVTTIKDSNASASELWKKMGGLVAAANGRSIPTENDLFSEDFPWGEWNE